MHDTVCIHRLGPRIVVGSFMIESEQFLSVLHTHVPVRVTVSRPLSVV